MRLQLTAAAILLFAAAPAAADDGDWEIASDTLVYGDTDNVVVLSPQITVHRALDNSGGEATARALVDVISAASVDVVSQASVRFSEVREEVDLTLSKDFDGRLPSVGYRYSHEPDYESNGVNGGLQLRLGTPDSVLGVTYGFTFDRVGRTGTPSSVFSETLTTHDASLSFTQVLNRRTLVRGVYSLTLQDGFMEKPYRFVPLFDRAGLQAAAADGVDLNLDTFDDYRLDARPPEEVPDTRQRHAFGVRAVRWLDSLDASLKVDYQLYVDDWGIVAHTVESTLQTGLGRDRDMPVIGAVAFGFSAYGRLYVQSAADFWERTYVVDAPDQIPRYRTVDRELSSYQSATGGLRLDWKHGDWTGYFDGSAMYTQYDEFLYLDQRLALVGLGGLRWAF